MAEKQHTPALCDSEWKWHQLCYDYASMHQERDYAVLGCSDISWTICRQSAPRFRQMTTPTPHHSIFTGRMPFLSPKQQRQSTEGGKLAEKQTTSVSAFGQKERNVR